jgi:hypothetical protein
MQRRRALLPTGGKRVKTCTPQLPFGRRRVISRFAIGYCLDNCNGDCGEQEDVNEAPFMQDELQNEPNQQEYSSNRPHSRNLSNELWKSAWLVTSAAYLATEVAFLRLRLRLTQKTLPVSRTRRFVNRPARFANSNNQGQARSPCIARQKLVHRRIRYEIFHPRQSGACICSRLFVCSIGSSSGKLLKVVRVFAERKPLNRHWETEPMDQASQPRPKPVAQM